MRPYAAFYRGLHSSRAVYTIAVILVADAGGGTGSTGAGGGGIITATATAAATATAFSSSPASLDAYLASQESVTHGSMHESHLE